MSTNTVAQQQSRIKHMRRVVTLVAVVPRIVRKRKRRGSSAYIKTTEREGQCKQQKAAGMMRRRG
eukprot:scaffold121398_cov17-Tisochrysis_lutea.AAC.1